MTNKSLLGYVAAPLSADNNFKRMENVMGALHIGNILRKKEIACIVPHSLSLFSEDVIHERDWLEFDKEIIRRCDFVIFHSNWKSSVGCQIEMCYCRENNIPFFELPSITAQAIENAIDEIKTLIRKN